MALRRTFAGNFSFVTNWAHTLYAHGAVRNATIIKNNTTANSTAITIRIFSLKVLGGWFIDTCLVFSAATCATPLVLVATAISVGSVAAEAPVAELG